MTETFIWPVHATAGGSGEFTTRAAKFGDGYTQEVPHGINNETQKWNVSVSGYKSFVKDTVLAFIRARKGTSFYWKSPMSNALGLYKCKRWSVGDQGGGYYVLSLEFEQTYAP